MNPFYHNDNKYYNLNPPSYMASQSTGPTSFVRHRSDSTSSGDSTSGGENRIINDIKHRLLERQEPALIQARQHLLDAEATEKEADRAHLEAKQRVKEARRALHKLARQAREEAKRIRSNQLQGQQMTSGFMQLRRR